MLENTKLSASKRDFENKKRVCNLYGVCGKKSTALESHDITHFGLQRLNPKK